MLSGLLLVFLPFLIPGLGKAMEIAPLHLNDWLLVAGVALGLLGVVEIGKWATNKRRSTRQSAR